MSLIAYTANLLIADRSCINMETAIPLNDQAMVKIHRSACGSVVAAHCGDFIPKDRIDYLMTLVVARLRMHQMENADAVIIGTIVLKGIDLMTDTGRNNWIFMTKAGAYHLVDDLLLPLEPTQIYAAGTLATTFHTYLRNGYSPEQAIERTIAITPGCELEYDIVRQSDLSDLHVDADTALLVMDAIQRLENAKGGTDVRSSDK